MFKYLMLCLVFMLTFSLSACSDSTTTNVNHNTDSGLTALKVEYRTQPMGIDVEIPRFNWQMKTNDEMRGQIQQTYQLKVRDHNRQLVWDSGIVNSSKSLHIPYQGKPLEPRTRYLWDVTVWDGQGNSHHATDWFETGLLSPSIDAWNGAKWIGGGEGSLPLYASYLPLFNLAVDIKITNGSEEAAVVFAANDPRMMDQYKNIYQMQSGHNESYFKIALNVSGVSDGKPATLSFYRSGYTPDDDPETPLHTVAIKQSVIDATNQYDFHHLLINNSFGTVTVQLNEQTAFWIGASEQAAQGFESMFPPVVKGASYQLNPLGPNHDYLTYGMLADIGFAVPAGNQAVFKNLKVHNMHQPNAVLFEEKNDADYKGIFANADRAWFNADAEGYRVTGSNHDVIITADPSRNAMPLLRTEFTLADKEIDHARLYVTARGIYEYYINGKQVSQDYYNPGLTQYNKTHLYQTYDVTSALTNGENAMGAMLGEGWWSGMLGFGNVWNGFGDRQSLLAQLIVTYKDGTESIISTQPDRWQFSTHSPVIYGSLAMGEVYDARVAQQITGWSVPGFNSTWKAAHQIILADTKAQQVQPNMMVPAQTLDYSNMQLVGQIDEPARVFDVVSAKRVEEVRPGVYVYDLGQNIVGVPRLHFANGKSGRIVTVRFAEMLYPDLPDSGDNVGMIMTENYRAALSQDKYIMKDGQQTFQPHFTSHGFQYIEVTGIDSPLPLEDVQGVVISSVQKLTATFASSSPAVNQLWSNLVWSNIGNFLSVPTDCPQRNERMGWSGDINVFSPTATFVSDTSQFMRRHLTAMRDTQSLDGRFADVAPVGGGFGGILWGVAGITIPWEVYNQYGDTELLEQHYHSMHSYMDYLASKIDPTTNLMTDAGLGDWLGPQNNQLGVAFLATAYHIYALDIMTEIAGVLGHADDVSEFSKQKQERKDFFNERFVNEDGVTMGYQGGPTLFYPEAPPATLGVADTQTSYAVGLALDAFNQDIRDKMIEKLKAKVQMPLVDDDGITRPANSLMTGFIGTAWISKALSNNGLSDEAYRLLLNDNYPSWLYPIEQGATTIWERLNGYTVENGFSGNNSMNSFNHYSFGAVGEWLITHAGGIRRDEPGFKSFILQPDIDPRQQVSWIKASYDSPYGLIKSSWKVDTNTLIYQVEVPANSSATVILPVKAEELMEGHKALKDVEGVFDIRTVSGKVEFKIGSGSYLFKGELL